MTDVDPVAVERACAGDRNVLRDAWLAECWPVVREVPREDRESARAACEQPVDNGADKSRRAS